MRWAWLSTVSLALCTMSFTAGANEELERIRDCLGHTDDARRLKCYDREVALFFRDDKTITVPVIAKRITQAELVDEFGMRGEILRKALEKRQRENPRLERLDASVVKLSTGPTGAIVLELDNGQVWEQTRGRPVEFIKPGDSVYLTRGALGTFVLTTPTRLAVRVKRIR